jgi:phospholipase C
MRRVGRHQAVTCGAALAVAVAVAAPACNAPPSPGPRSNLGTVEAAAARATCTFGAGTLPGLSLAHDAPLGAQIPVDTIVLLMFENRSFDHLLGNLPAYGQPDVDVAPDGAANLSSSGASVPRFHQSDYCFDDTNHDWWGSWLEYGDGRNDGFVRANDGFQGATDGGRRAMGYYTEADVPFFYSLASTYALADRSFASLLGPTGPNRAFFLAGTSFGETDVDYYTEERHPVLYEQLEAAHLSWRTYYTNLPSPGLFLANFAQYLDHSDDIEQFFAVAAAGKLEHVVFVDPDLRGYGGGGRNDLHPPGDVQSGEAFLARVVDAVTHSPQWPRLALFVTFDEWGGLYDHVPPPRACPPDATAPILKPTDPPGGFDRLGFRVPTIVVSPWARPHHVSHVVYDHTSILRFIEARFGLPAMTARDANADPMFDLFDFGRPSLRTPPALPASTVDMQKLADCLARYPPSR